MKTKEDWNGSGLQLSEYMPEPCEIDEELYMYIGEVVAPHYLGTDDLRGLMQGGDPEGKVEGYYIEDDIFTYMTVSEVNDKYFYLGILPEFKQ